jgi:hypothetical protein
VLIKLEEPVRKISLILILVILTNLLSACASKREDAPVKAVEDYLNALVAKDSDRLTTLSCSDWEDDALLELDSFQAVTTKLDGLACSQTGTDGDTALVLCKGKIIATYNNENQELDLSTRTYQVVQQDGDWQICGTR